MMSTASVGSTPSGRVQFSQVYDSIVVGLNDSPILFSAVTLPT